MNANCILVYPFIHPYAPLPLCWPSVLSGQLFDPRASGQTTLLGHQTPSVGSLTLLPGLQTQMADAQTPFAGHQSTMNGPQTAHASYETPLVCTENPFGC